MTRAKKPETEAKEVRLQEALEGIESGRFKSVYHARQEMPDVPKTTLYERLHGCVPRNKAHEDQEILTCAEEQELAGWISQMTRVNCAPSHPLVRHMAEHIRSRRVCNINEEYIQFVHYEPLGKHWVTRFMRRHPQLQTVLPRPIEGACVKDSLYEAIKRYFEHIHSVIDEYNIREENIYNMDESGFAISTIEASKVIIEKQSSSNSIYHQAQPGRQEWVTSVECICMDGSFLPPLIIFKAENFSRDWVPANAPKDWGYSNNSQGWMSNMHGAEWL